MLYFCPVSTRQASLQCSNRRGVLLNITMKVNYTKKCTLPPDLIPLLKNRGLFIEDEQQAISYLTNIGYFRLSAYCYPFLKKPKNNHVYKIGATFNLVMNTERYVRWCGRSEREIIPFLLTDCTVMEFYFSLHLFRKISSKF